MPALHRAHSFRGQWCFYRLSFAQMSFNSCVNMDSSRPSLWSGWNPIPRFPLWPLTYGLIGATFNSVLWKNTASTFLGVFRAVEPFIPRPGSRWCSMATVGVYFLNLLSPGMSENNLFLSQGQRSRFKTICLLSTARRRFNVPARSCEKLFHILLWSFDLFIVFFFNQLHPMFNSDQ